jgi:hypothetical protein
MNMFLVLAFPLGALYLGGNYGPLSLGLVLLAAYRYGLLGASLAGAWAGLWAAVPSGMLLPHLTVPPLLAGCLAGWAIEKRPVMSLLQRAVFALSVSALTLILQLLLTGGGTGVLLHTLLASWWKWAVLSAGVFWLLSLLFPWREW